MTLVPLYFPNSLNSIMKVLRVESVVDMLSERWCIQQPAKNRNIIPIGTLDAAKIVPHA